MARPRRNFRVSSLHLGISNLNRQHRSCRRASALSSAFHFHRLETILYDQFRGEFTSTLNLPLPDLTLESQGHEFRRR